MKFPSGHATRLFLGFTCSVMFLVVFAVLVAYNTEAESAAHSPAISNERALAITIPTSRPEETIAFYSKLGFRTVPGLGGDFDVITMEKDGNPYKLEICHNKFSEAGRLVGGVSGLSFRVRDLSSMVEDLKSRGLRLGETYGSHDGFNSASLIDPNGISVKLFER